MTIQLSSPILVMGRETDSVTISRRRTGADVLAELGIVASDQIKLLRIRQMCELPVGSEKQLRISDIYRIYDKLLEFEGEPTQFESWPLKLQHPLPGLSEIHEPRHATGADIDDYARDAVHDTGEERMFFYARLVCGITKEQFMKMDAADIITLTVACVPFWLGSPVQ